MAVVRSTGAGAGHGAWGGAVEGLDVLCVPEPQRGICGDDTSSVQVGGAVPGRPRSPAFPSPAASALSPGLPDSHTVTSL